MNLNSASLIRQLVQQTNDVHICILQYIQQFLLVYASGSQPGRNSSSRRNFMSSGEEFLLLVKLPIIISVLFLFKVDIGSFN